MEDQYFTESKNEPLKKPVTALLPFLWGMVRPYKQALLVTMVAVAIASGTVLAFGWGLKHLIDEGFTDQTGRYLNQALLVLLGVILLLAIASYTRFYLMSWVAERVIADLRKKVYGHLLSLDTYYFERGKTGDQVSRINTDTTVLQMVLTTNLPMAFRHCLTLIGGIIMLFIVSPVMTAMVLTVVPLVLLPIIYFGRKVRSKSKDTQTKIGDMTAFAGETISGIQTVQSFGYEPIAYQRFADTAESVFVTALKYVKLRAFLIAFVISMIFAAIGIVLWIGGHKVLTGELSAGALSAFVFYAITTAGAVGALSEVVTAFNQATGAADRIFSLLEQSSVLRGHDSNKALPTKLIGDITFEEVRFRYPSRPENLALSDVSFKVKAGSIVAIVGPSGAGKTTIFQLLQRLYDPTGGRILIDGFDAAEFKPEDIRHVMATVAQDPTIFSVSIAENIRMGKDDATDAEVMDAAKMAQAHDFIIAMPDGYATAVGERGARLSGGQRQRIAIARALLKNPRILLLDEATSALDSANEEAVMVGLKNLMQGRTTLIIAHRLSTVQNADKIIVLDQGRVMAEGTHDQLYRSDSLYTHLAGLQARVG